jgi:glutaredoxin
MTVLTLYSKPDCHLCTEARAVVERLRDELEIELVERDISADPELHRAYFDRIPVLALDGEELFEYFVEEASLRERLREVLPPKSIL